MEEDLDDGNEDLDLSGRPPESLQEIIIEEI
jgi:hypothetical protein